MATEFLGPLDGSQIINGSVGGSNRSDGYAFTLSSSQAVHLSVSNGVELLLSRGRAFGTEPQSTQLIATTSIEGQQSIDRILGAGVYVVEIDSTQPSQSNQIDYYSLQLSIDSLTNQYNVGVLNDPHSFIGLLTDEDGVDRYQFSLNSTRSFGASLTELSADADMALARDSNNNGLIDQGELIVETYRDSNLDELMDEPSLSAGNYLLEVTRFSGETHYRLRLNATALDTPSSPLDLAGRFEDINLPDSRILNTPGNAEFILVNQSSQFVDRLTTVRLYASTDKTYDSNDELLSSETVSVALGAGQAQTINFGFNTPTAVAAGSYYLIARVDANNTSDEKDESNNFVVVHASAPGTDVVLDWNATLLNAIQQDKTAPPLAARNQAIVHVAIFDAVNAIERQYAPSQVAIPSYLTLNSDASAAAVQAAYQTLVALYPDQKADFDAQRRRSLAEIVDGTAKSNGVIIGQFVADQIIESRLNDGASAAQTEYVAPNIPGAYQSTRSDNFALLPNWGGVTPFVISDVDDFVPGGPPAYGSAQYAIELNQVQQIGRYDSTTRTANQTEIAYFWAYDRPDTFRPPSQWNQLAEVVALQANNTLLDNARLFAMLNLAQADAGITAWKTKYTYTQLRPITAVHQANTDGNLQTIADSTWQSLLSTPPFPDYVSGHSTFGAAAAEVLTYFYGDNYQFDVTSEEIPGIYRTFNSFWDAAEENGISRIYGGIHVQSANEDGLAIGKNIASYIVNNALQPIF